MTFKYRDITYDTSPSLMSDEMKVTRCQFSHQPSKRGREQRPADRRQGSSSLTNERIPLGIPSVFRYTSSTNLFKTFASSRPIQKYKIKTLIFRSSETWRCVVN